jgi:type II secretory pathway component PulF
MILLQMPFLGSFLTALESLDFCFALELCSRAGMNIDASLKEAQSVLRNRAYNQAIGMVRTAIIAGKSLSEAFLSQPIFPLIIGKWISVGEQTGEAEMVFVQLKNFFEESVDTFTDRFLSNLEPVLMLLTGLIIMLLVLQFVLPLFSLYGVLI